MRPAGPLLVLIGLLFTFAAPAQQNISREEAESRIKELNREIGLLQQSLVQSRQQFASEQDGLRKADLSVQASALRLRELQNQRSAHQAQLHQLESDRSDYLRSLKDSKSVLNEQIIAAYQLGRESRLKLLLNQDSPARLSRMLAYYEYFSRAQVEQIGELQLALATLDQMQANIDKALLELVIVEQRQEQELDELQGQREQRLTLVAALSGQIDSGEARLDELTRNRQDLETLLKHLSSALADIPSELGQYVSPKDQRGSIPLPVKGRVLHAFGQSRGNNLSWQGWLIEAKPGTDVHAIAYGRVAFADWLRGYGLLMIIDHGDEIMSLYGNNESLLHEVGDWIQPGSVISTVGVNPGTGQGLYFELRNKGKAIDPATWIAR